MVLFKTLPLLFGTILAGPAEIAKGIFKKCEEIAMHEGIGSPLFKENGLCYYTLDKIQGRAYTANYAALLNVFNGYGCWCYFFENYQRGYGEPQSVIDVACKVLQDGYKCIEMDAEASGVPCPHQQVYYSTGGHFLSGCYDDATGDPLVKGECKSNVCEVEQMFIQTMFQISHFGVTGNDQDPTILGHQFGNFNVEETCVRAVIEEEDPSKGGGGGGGGGSNPSDPNNGGGGGGGDSGDPTVEEADYICCGVEYPFRWPYKDFGINECCDDGTYQISCPL